MMKISQCRGTMVGSSTAYAELCNIIGVYLDKMSTWWTITKFYSAVGVAYSETPDWYKSAFPTAETANVWYLCARIQFDNCEYVFGLGKTTANSVAAVSFAVVADQELTDSGRVVPSRVYCSVNSSPTTSGASLSYNVVFGYDPDTKDMIIGFNSVGATIQPSSSLGYEGVGMCKLLINPLTTFDKPLKYCSYAFDTTYQTRGVSKATMGNVAQLLTPTVGVNPSPITGKYISMPSYVLINGGILGTLAAGSYMSFMNDTNVVKKFSASTVNGQDFISLYPMLDSLNYVKVSIV